MCCSYERRGCDVSIETALFEIVTSRLAADVGDRLYPRRLPQGVGGRSPVLPAIVYHRIDSPEVGTHDDEPGRGTLIHARFQFDVWGRTADEAADVGRRLRNAIRGVRGRFGDTSIDALGPVGEYDGEDEVPGRWRRIVDAEAWFREDG